ncbi:MAG: hypothetical protein VKP70_01580 [Cyanobacteriota bacterium]|nr:hypothetical protein [Cyanobacteriota bacterium]
MDTASEDGFRLLSAGWAGLMAANISFLPLLASAFPVSSPFRVDQVTSAPALMAALAMGQVVVAAGMDLCARRAWQRLWWIGVGGLLILTLVLFTLATWGTSDTTKLNHLFAVDRAGGTIGEPLWWLLGPALVHLPYRMALVHGLVASAYAGAMVVLARYWRAPAWAGWWALFLTCSPLLRSFLQNGITRQALSTLLLLPLFLRLSGLLAVRRPIVLVSAAGAALSHTTVPFSLAMALSPLLVGFGSSRWLTSLRRRWLWFLLPPVLVVLVVVFPVAVQKLALYASVGRFFSSYSLLPEVRRLQVAMALGVAGACWQHRLGPGRLLRCPLSRLFFLFGGTYGLLQQAVEKEWLASIAFRLSDGVGFFLLILYLAWLVHYKSLAWLWPALLVTLHSWLFIRILPSGELACGKDDAFLCIPDRWPWQVQY